MNEIYVDVELTEAQTRRLREGVGQARLHSSAGVSPAEARAAFDLCDIAFGNPPRDWIDASAKLRWVQLESVGFGEYLALDWARLGERVAVTNLAGFFAQPVAESILAGVLALYRGIDALTNLKRDRHWLGDGLRPGLKTLRNRHVVLFGRGAINTRLGEMLQPFDCRVVSFGRDWRADALDAQLARADLVVSVVPDMPQTRGVFDRARFARFARGAVFANFGRGSVVDETALVDALAAEALGGAVIDVTRDEPLPADHPLWTAPRTILTQHTGGGSGGEVDGKLDVFLANLQRFRQGEALQGRVDFSRGY